MKVRKAREQELDAVLAIYEKARRFMRATGNPTQWGESYPPSDTVKEDISNGNLYVIDDDGVLCGVFAFFPSGDKLYDKIDGSWLNELPHAAIHRVASAGIRKGILAVCVNFCLEISNNLKIDTHADNAVMQKQLKKVGFTECGTVYLENGEPRIAFQLCR